MMIGRFDENDLIAWVEGELSPSRARKLEARLAKDPEVRTLVESMRADRDVLRSLPEPSLPTDFVAAVEPQLVRSMLMEDPSAVGSPAPSPAAMVPGAYRRKHQRPGARRLTIFAVAAMVLLTAFAGVWGALVMMAHNESTLVATTPTAPTRDASASDTALTTAMTTAVATAPGLVDLADDAPVPADAVVHHRAPVSAPQAAPLTVPERAHASTRTPDGSAAPRAADASAPVRLEFALVIRADDVAAVEAMLVRVLGDDGDDGNVGDAGHMRGSTRDARHAATALVQNLSMREAQQLFALARSDRPDAPETMTSFDTNVPPNARQREDMLESVRQRLAVESPNRAQWSKQLHGPARIAPSFEQQLEWSDLGATHTIVLPERRLASMLSRLRLEEGQRTSLRPLVSADTDALAEGDAPDGNRWLADYQLVSGFVNTLRTAGGMPELDRQLMLPVKIEPR